MSLTGTGMAHFRLGHVQTELWTPKPKTLRGAERLVHLDDRLDDYLDTRIVKPTLVAIEGYSYGSANGAARLGEWGGLFRARLYRRGIPYIEVSPNQVKKFVTGTGAGTKSVVMKSLLKRFGVDRDDDNEADACVLALIAACYYDQGMLSALIQPQQEVIAALKKEGK